MKGRPFLQARKCSVLAFLFIQTHGCPVSTHSRSSTRTLTFSCLVLLPLWVFCPTSHLSTWRFNQ
jgi:hypothetical protein